MTTAGARGTLAKAHVEQETHADCDEPGPLQQAKRTRQLAERKLVGECDRQNQRDSEQAKHVQNRTDRSFLAHLCRAHLDTVRTRI